MLAFVVLPHIILSFVTFSFITVISAGIKSDSTMAMRRAPPLLFPASAKHTATVIFVHGLGDTGYGWAPAVENWRRRQRLDEVKFILPHAPRIPVTAVSDVFTGSWETPMRIDR